MEKVKKISKMILVVRKDLNMRKGKIASQTAHAALKVILDLGRYEPVYQSDDSTLVIPIEHGTALKDWLTGEFTKICVSVNSEAELLRIYEASKKAGLMCSLIQDAGHTEFAGVPTYTCCAVGPNWSDEIDPITKDLSLL